MKIIQTFEEFINESKIFESKQIKKEMLRYNDAYVNLLKPNKKSTVAIKSIIGLLDTKYAINKSRHNKVIELLNGSHPEEEFSFYKWDKELKKTEKLTGAEYDEAKKLYLKIIELYSQTHTEALNAIKALANKDAELFKKHTDAIINLETMANNLKKSYKKRFKRAVVASAVQNKTYPEFAYNHNYKKYENDVNSILNI